MSVLARKTRNAAPPRDGLVRLMVADAAMPSGLELRDAADGTPVLHGHFAVFNRWTEIDSFFEGNFLESIAPGAFRKTMREQRDSMKVLFQHGRDPQIGMKPLGSIDAMREDKQGAAYEVSLLDAPYVRDTLLPGLRANLYGASFKFQVMREDIVQKPEPSDANPLGLPERTIKEARVFEFGPVTFPAYPEASAGVRSGTDDYFLEGLAHGDPDCVRAAASGSTFSVFIADRLGIRSDDQADQAEEAPEDAPEAPQAELAPEAVQDASPQDAPAEDAPERASVKENAPGCPSGMPHAVMNAGKMVACHATPGGAQKHAQMLNGGTNSQDDDAAVDRQAAESNYPSVDAAPEPPRRSATTQLLGVRKEPWRL